MINNPPMPANTPEDDKCVAKLCEMLATEKDMRDTRHGVATLKLKPEEVKEP